MDLFEGGPGGVQKRPPEGSGPPGSKKVGFSGGGGTPSGDLRSPEDPFLDLFGTLFGIPPFGSKSDLFDL